MLVNFHACGTSTWRQRTPQSEALEYGVCVDVLESLRIFGLDVLLVLAGFQQGFLPTCDPWGTLRIQQLFVTGSVRF